MPKIRTPWDRVADVDRGTPPVVLPDVNAPAEASIDPVATAPREARPEPRARFEARIREDGSVVLPESLLSPVMTMIGAWLSEHGPPQFPEPQQRTRNRRKLPRPQDAVLMNLDDFAATVGFSRRKIEQFVSEGMPTVGDHRSRRVVVKAAQEWVIKRLQDDGSEVVDRARADARKRRAG